MNTEIKETNNLTYILKDLFYGDMDVYQEQNIENIETKKLVKAVNYILLNPNFTDQEKLYLFENSWKLLYRIKPPTMEEFLTKEWIGETAESLYPWVRETLINFFDHNKPYRHLFACGFIGAGKAQPLNSKVLTPNGWVKMGSLKVGDIIKTPDNKESKIIEIHPQGKKDIYEIEFKDGSKVRCCEDHLWKVSKKYKTKNKKRLKDQRDWKILSLNQIKDLGLKWKNNSNKWFIPMTEPIEFEENNHYITPYVLGALLGDGGLTSRVTFTNMDEEIFNRISKELPEDIIIRRIPSSKYGYSIIDNQSEKGILKRKGIFVNRFKEELTRLGQMKKLSYDKYIPEEYKIDSIKNRIALLQGILDTDGSVSSDGIISLELTSKRLIFDVKEIVESLGGVCTFRIKPSHKNKGYHEVYRLRINLPDFNLFYLTRKKELVKTRRPVIKYKPTRNIKNISYIGKDEAQCISIDHPDMLYLTDNYIVTHNSFASVLSNLYISVHLWCMRSPKKFFGLSPATILVQLLISFTMDKSKELLLDPFKEILLSTNRFVKCRTEDSLKKKQKEAGDNHIIYTTAGTHALQFTNGINYKLASDPAKLLGVTAVSVTLSEISFFVDRGFSYDYIWRVYQDSKTRVYSRLYNHYYARTIIDSSPNDIELSPIDRYVFSGEALKPDNTGKCRNYIFSGAMWDYKKDEFKNLDKTFPIFKGGQGKPPKILNEDETKNYHESDLIRPPLEIKHIFEENLIKNIKDLAGYPSGGQDKLITDIKIIEDCFYPHLKNVYDTITAPAHCNPKGLIWDQIKSTFFIEIETNRFELLRSPYEERYLAVDQSENGDITAIVMVHPEINNKGEMVIVSDFTIGIKAEKDKINIDATAEFIIDLAKKGNVKFGGISFDQYQSSGNKQRVERELDIKITNSLSDREMNPYLVLVSWLKNRKIKIGKNIFLKNNLASIQESKTKSGKKKVDHTQGKIVNDFINGVNWKTDMRGINAKDLSDGLAMASFMCINSYSSVPRYQWVEFEKKHLSNEEIKKSVLQSIAEKYRLKPV
jgi:hypothetical protein